MSSSRALELFHIHSSKEYTSSSSSDASGGGIVEQTCHIQCLEGYELEGSEKGGVVTCINGTRNIHEVTKCIKSRPSLTFEDDNTLVQNSSCSGQVGDACTIHNKPGFIFAGGIT